MICIYHKNCADGFGAAWTVRKAFPDRKIEFILAQYGDKPPDVIDKDVIIVDFSYSRAVLLEMKKVAKSILVIDHHESAEKELSDLPFTIYDNSQSGAVLTYKYLYNDNVPILLKYIQDRDLWKWEIAGSKEISAAIRSYPFDFNVWDNFDISQLMNEGKAILRYQESCVKLALSHEYELVEIGGYKVPCLNQTHLISEIGNELCKEYPFAACYFDIKDKRVFSLRSNENGINVAEIAKQYGGGGHKNAAGFSTNKPEIGANIE